MSTAAVPMSRDRRLLTRVTCPHCWERFTPESVLWVAEHVDLMGDMRLGNEKMQRFLPSRFNADGKAIDAKGFACQTIACPRCHLTVPRGMLELDPLFISIVGAPGSGKSVFLASMIWELRKVLGAQFGLSFTDADTVSNARLNGYEESLFMSNDPEKLVPLGQLIEKTDNITTNQALYDAVMLGRQSVRFPKPFLFSIQPDSQHPNAAKANRLGRILTLYDNAGESFQPGEDQVDSPVTRHLAHAAALMMVFDPTQDQRFRQKCQQTQSGHLFAGHKFVKRQEPIIQEVAARVRQHGNLRQNEKHKSPLIVLLTKYDSWYELLPAEDYEEPWKLMARKDPSGRTQTLAALDVGRIERRSGEIRRLLLGICPEVVNSAEAFAEKVTYVAVSSLGWGVEVDATTAEMSIRAKNAAPYWATTPMLYALQQTVPGLVPTVPRK